eukprot:g2954.t1
MANVAVLGVLMTESVCNLFKRVVHDRCCDMSATCSLPIKHRETVDQEASKWIRTQILTLIDDAKRFYSSDFLYENDKGFQFDLPRRLDFRSDLTEFFTVPDGDPRVGLSGQRGVRATQFIQAHTVLGIYRGLMLPKVVTDLNLLKNPRVGWNSSVAEWKRRVEKYLVSVTVEVKEPGFPQNREASCDISSFEYENPSSFINDVRIDPYKTTRYPPDIIDGTRLLFEDEEETIEKISEPNVKFLRIWIADFPFPFVMTTRAIRTGEELLMDYGADHFQR